MQLKILNKSFNSEASKFQWTNVYGLARTFLALGTLLTLCFNDVGILFRQGVGVEEFPSCIGPSAYSLFCFFSHDLVLAKGISIVILLSVISGFYPRITGILHWWVSFSFMNSSLIVDGGDQVTAVLTLLILPICLTDGRRNHWQNATSPVEIPSLGLNIRQIVAFSTLWIIRIQVAFIYFHAGIAKLEVEEWANGTALYYWFNNTMLGASDWLSPILNLMTSNAVFVSFSTWGILLLEILLFAAIFMRKKDREKLLIVGIVFHFGIILIFGLVSFFCAMAAALILYLRPFEKTFSFNVVKTKQKTQELNQELIFTDVLIPQKIS